MEAIQASHCFLSIEAVRHCHLVDPEEYGQLDALPLQRQILVFGKELREEYSSPMSPGLSGRSLGRQNHQRQSMAFTVFGAWSPGPILRCSSSKRSTRLTAIGAVDCWLITCVFAGLQRVRYLEGSGEIETMVLPNQNKLDLPD